ncbi:MAG: hypothetical protein ACE5H4_00215 [Candidatus Thorarchaeota archaeon]
MSDASITCPSCGSEVPVGRYCNSCGTPLSMTGDKIPEHTTLEILDNPVVPSKDESVDLPEFGMTVEGMDRREFATLMSRAELQVIRKELDGLVEQIQSTRQALQLRHADKAILTARAEGLRTAFDKTKSRREELSSFRGSLSLESILQSLEEYEKKRTKLEEMKESLDQAVYKEQKTKIIDTVKTLRKELKNSVKQAENWLKSMKKTGRTLNREGSRLDAQHKIGDISARNYEGSKAKIERSIMILEVSRSILDEVLIEAKKKK